MTVVETIARQDFGEWVLAREPPLNVLIVDERDVQVGQSQADAKCEQEQSCDECAATFHGRDKPERNSPQNEHGDDAPSVELAEHAAHPGQGWFGSEGDAVDAGEPDIV